MTHTNTEVLVVNNTVTKNIVRIVFLVLLMTVVVEVYMNDWTFAPISTTDHAVYTNNRLLKDNPFAQVITSYNITTVAPNIIIRQYTSHIIITASPNTTQIQDISHSIATAAPSVTKIRDVSHDIKIAAPKNNKIQNKLKLYVDSKGRLGNILFQLASLYGLSRQTNRTPIFSESSSKIRNLKSVFPHLDVQIKPNINCPKCKTVREIRLHYTPSIWSSLPNTDVIACCFLQSFRLFENVEEDIRKGFTFSTKIQAIVNQKFRNIWGTLNVDKSVKVTYIGIHMRRGDLTSASSYRSGYRLPKPTYIKKAMEYYRHKYHDSITVFIVSSDDIEWCKKNINFPDTHFIHGSPEIDMGTLAACNHSITTTGSFSWWSGYLAGGKVIYYKDQFAKGSNMEVANPEDRFPAAWIPMED